MKYEKCKLLFEDNFKKLQKANILILGVGGVGGYALDCLYKTGITNITIVDFDSFDISNQNRQIGSEAVGISKVKHLKTLYPQITIKKEKIDTKWIKNNDLSSYDMILDAIDDIIPKVALIKKYYQKLITTSGSANRIDSTCIEYISIWETFNDPFIKNIRKTLKREGFDEDFKVIFSGEVPINKAKGSFVGVTGSFGLAMCSVAIQTILKKI
jgi:tRNA A37 threonylcarbamoyladenosine dehydratase